MVREGQGVCVIDSLTGEKAAGHMYTDFLSWGETVWSSWSKKAALRNKFKGKNTKWEAWNKCINDSFMLNMSFGVEFLMTAKENAIERKANQLENQKTLVDSYP